MKLDDVASKLDLNRHKLSEAINRKYSESFPSILNDYRLKHSMKLLKENGDNKIIAIAFNSGFNTLASFNANFKRQYGITPSEYRKSRREEEFVS